MTTYEAIDVRPVTRRIGAEILGIDLSRPLSNHQAAELRDALAHHQVLFFRDQNLSHDAHKAFGRLFGELAIHSGVPGLPDHPEIVAIHADETSKFVAGESFHSDLTCDAEPPLGSILYMPIVPESGGDTVFASMAWAYETLSDKMKAYLEGMTAVHDADHVYRPLFPDVDKKYPCSTHPIVRTHPVTGRKSIFVNPSYTTKIVGVEKEESDAILNYLYRHCMNPNFQVRFRWRANSVAFWDNRGTWHQAIWDYFPDTRSGFRVTVAGDKPF
ncbi:TauD/TfdA family dioxygenase [Phenylobacterium aquaticum]|uniref:TauD/TfdA dioxygenase family protein n=1 Tax=Phenylobacterium aquaticum TaxID=1763816 RepID=UPI0026EFCFE1|nr:TauD/TfdA family dioxygenase [Phenylobacterium aquaticum]